MDIHVRQYWYPDANGTSALKVYKFFRKVGPRKYELIPELMDYGFASKARAENRARQVEAEYAAKEAAEAARHEPFVCNGCLDGWCDGCVPETDFECGWKGLIGSQQAFPSAVGIDCRDQSHKNCIIDDKECGHEYSTNQFRSRGNPISQESNRPGC